MLQERKNATSVGENDACLMLATGAGGTKWNVCVPACLLVSPATNVMMLFFSFCSCWEVRFYLKPKSYYWKLESTFSQRALMGTSPGSRQEFKVDGIVGNGDGCVRL